MDIAEWLIVSSLLDPEIQSVLPKLHGLRSQSGGHYHEKGESLPERLAQRDVHPAQYMKGFELVGLEGLFSSISA